MCFYIHFLCLFLFLFLFKGDSGGPLHVKGIYGQLEVVGMYLVIIN